MGRNRGGVLTGNESKARAGAGAAVDYGAGRVVAGDISGSMSEWSDLRRELEERGIEPPPDGRENTRGAWIAAIQGFNGPATVVSKAEMDKLIEQGGLEIYRGLAGAEHRDALLGGKHWAGYGVYGNGTYFASAEGEVARNSKNRANHALRTAEIYGDHITRATLKPGARRAEWRDLAANRPSHTDIGDYAAAAGYDYYIHPHEGHVVVLNRTALILQREQVTPPGRPA